MLKRYARLGSVLVCCAVWLAGLCSLPGEFGIQRLKLYRYR